MAKNKANYDVLVGALSYLLIGIVWYFVDKNVQNAFTKHHVKQALNLLIVNIGLNVIFMFLWFIPFIWSINSFLSFVIFVFWIIGLVHVFKKSKAKIPLIGDLPDKYLTF